MEESAQERLLLLPDDEGSMPIPPGSGMFRVDTAMVRQTAEHMRVKLSASGSDALPAWEKTRLRLSQGDVGAWRGALATALLMDTWDCDCRLEMVDYAPGDSEFVRSALSASGKDALHLIVLCRDGDMRVLGIADADLALVLPASGTSLLGVLPERLTWYDRDKCHFIDPCRLLTQTDRLLLLQRLALLRQTPEIAAFAEAVKEREASAEAEALFADAEAPSAKAEAPSAEAWQNALKAVIALVPEGAALGMEKEIPVYHRGAIGNALLKCLGIVTPEAKVRERAVYRWRGVPFAWENDRVGVELMPGQEVAIEEMAQTLALLLRYSRRFSRALPERINAYMAERDMDFSPKAQDLLVAWCAAVLDGAVKPPEQLVLDTTQRLPETVKQALLAEYLPEHLAQAAREPFTPRLTLFENTSAPGTLYQVRLDEHTYSLLTPLSESMADAVARYGWPGGASPQACVHISQSPAGVEVTLFLVPDGQVQAHHAYSTEEMNLLNASDAPDIAFWPAVAEETGWHAYWLTLRGTMEARCFDRGQWLALRSEQDAFRVLETGSLPRCVTLHGNDGCLGALFCQLTSAPRNHLGEAVVALDAGSTGTAIAMLLAGQVQPLTLPTLTCTLLGALDASCPLPQTALGPVIPTAVRLWEDGKEPCPFMQGTLPPDTLPLENAWEDNIDADLLWRGDTRATHARKLYFRQLALLCTFHAMMCGADTISWRITLPSAMARDGRARLLREIASACSFAEHESGLPRTPDTGVELLRGSLAAGLQLRGSGLMRGAFALLDVGGSCASMALWLRGMNRPAAEFQAQWGVTAMLLPDIMEDPTLLERELASALDGLPKECLRALAIPGTAAWSHNRLLVDQVLGPWLPQSSESMNACFRAAHPTRTQALLLLGYAALMTLTGCALEQVRQNPMLNDFLPPELQLCLCGRGTLPLAHIDPALSGLMASFVRIPMSWDHPVRMLGMTLSASPKLEAVLGVGMLRGLTEDAPDSDLLPMMPLLHLAVKFLAQFRAAYPQHSELLFPGMFDQEGRFTKEAENRITRAAQDFASLPVEEALPHVLDQLRRAYRPPTGV